MAESVHIGKAAKLAGTSVDTVRFYQKLGLTRNSTRSAGGYRLFDSAQIRELKFIRHAQELGFSLNEIKELLALRQEHHTCSEVQSMLKAKLTDVRAKIKSLVHLEAELDHALRNCNRELHLKQDVQHEDCCPLLEQLDRMNGVKGKKDVASARKSARK